MMKSIPSATLTSDYGDVNLSFGENEDGDRSFMIQQGNDLIAVDADDSEFFAEELMSYVKLARKSVEA